MSRKTRRRNRNKSQNKNQVMKEQLKAEDLSNDTRATLASVRKLEFTELAGVTPQGLASILKEASKGNITDFITIAEKMEELDLHYQSVLSTRKRSLTGLQPYISDELCEDKEVIAYANQLNSSINMRSLISSLADGLGKGFAAVEISWNTEGNLWIPDRLKWVDQRHFIFDKTGHQLRIKDKDKKEGLPLEDLRYILHFPKLKSGIPARNGLARLAAWCFLYKNYTMKDWLAFLEVYGMPLRLGRYGANATEEEKRTLLRAVANIGSDAAAIAPKGMEIEFVTNGASGRGGLFKEMAEYLDKQLSKGVLGQTMTTDDGSSQAQAKVHNEVRIDILEADAADIEETINEYLIKPAIDINMGLQEFYPKWTLPVPENDDATEWIKNARTAAEMGIAVSKTQIRNKVRLDEPTDDDDSLVLSPKIKKGSGAEQEKPKKNKTEKTSHQGCECCSDKIELASTKKDDELDLLSEEALKNWPQDLAGFIDPIRNAVEKANSFDEMVQLLDEKLPNYIDAGAVIETLATAGFKARGLGDATDDV